MSRSTAADLTPPLCVCHGEPKAPRSDIRGWRCAVKQQEYRARYDRTEKGRARTHRKNASEHVKSRKAIYELTRIRAY